MHGEIENTYFKIKSTYTFYIMHNKLALPILTLPRLNMNNKLLLKACYKIIIL